MLMQRRIEILDQKKSSEFLFFLDSDCLLTDDLINELSSITLSEKNYCGIL